jgi:hypothetical protein
MADDDYLLTYRVPKDDAAALHKALNCRLLWERCRAFIETQKIGDASYISEIGVPDVLDFLESVCDIVGYYGDSDND